MERLDATIAVVSTWFSLTAAALIGVIMIVMTTDVVVRNASGGSIAGAYETTTVLLVVVVFLGLAHAERTGTNVRLTLLTSRLPRRSAFALRTFSGVLTLGLALWFAWATWDKAAASYARGEAQLGLISVPVWPARFAIAIGFSVLAIEVLLGLRRRFMELSAPEVTGPGRAGGDT